MPDLSFSDQVRERVAQSGITMYALGKRTGIDKSALSRFVRGERWLSETAINLIAAEIGMQVKQRPGRKRGNQ
jgi:transcriptional regulator with XRE-family HTH domain